MYNCEAHQNRIYNMISLCESGEPLASQDVTQLLRDTKRLATALIDQDGFGVHNSQELCRAGGLLLEAALPFLSDYPAEMKKVLLYSNLLKATPEERAVIMDMG